MTVLAGVTDRTEHTRSIEHSSQVSRTTGERIGIFDGRRTRALTGIDAILLHQTGFWQSARGNDVAAYDRMIAHFAILPDGNVLQLRDLEARLNSASQDYGVDIEVVGCFNDDRFDPAVWQSHLAEGRARPRGCTPYAVSHSQGELPTLAQIEAGRRLIAALVSLDPIRGQIRYILAHRQVTRISRENCPGPHVWYNLGHWAGAQWHLSSTRRASNRPIPAAWQDPRFAVPPPCPDRAQEAPAGVPAGEEDGVLSLAQRRPGPIGEQAI